MPDFQRLPLPQQIALAYAPSDARGAWSALLHFDVRLANVIIQAREPMLAQIRLAWWRDALALPPEMRPQGDELLDAVSTKLPGIEDQLIDLVAAWECMLVEPPVTPEILEQYLGQRAGAYAAMHRLTCPDHADRGASADAQLAARYWVLGDTLPRLSNPDERLQAERFASGLPEARLPRLPRAMRPLSVLAVLARRSIARGGGEPMSHRLDALAALRVGMFGK